MSFSRAWPPRLRDYVVDLSVHQILTPGFDSSDLVVIPELVFHSLTGSVLEPQTGELARGPLQLSRRTSFVNVATELTGQPIKCCGAVEPSPAVGIQPHEKLEHEHTETKHGRHGRHQDNRLDDRDSTRAIRSIGTNNHCTGPPR